MHDRGDGKIGGVHFADTDRVVQLSLLGDVQGRAFYYSTAGYTLDHKHIATYRRRAYAEFDAKQINANDTDVIANVVTVGRQPRFFETIDGALD